MNDVMIMTVVKKALTVGVMIAGPFLGITLVVGLIISIFQATTQIQEQTLTFVPKVIAVILILILGGPWMMNKLVILTTEMFNMIATVVK